MNMTIGRTAIRALVIALGMAAVLGGVTAPARADDDGWRRHEWRERNEWREHEWRERGWYGYPGYPAPYGYYGGYYAPPPVVYAPPVYAPPPVVYPPPGLNIIVPFNFR